MNLAKKLLGVCIVSSLAGAPATQAAIEWQTFSLSYLKGDHYRVGDPQRQVTTFEHAAGTSWGDSFLFWDHLYSENGDNADYGEWSPRFSFCKIWTRCVDPNGANAVLHDLLISTTVEKGEGFTNFLYGLGVDLKLPGFKYFTLNAYRRMAEFKEDNWQATITWGLPFTLGNQAFLYDGFLDSYTGTRDEHASTNWTMQLKWNLGQNLSLKNPLYLGVEYAYWLNKFGIKDSPGFRTKETCASLLLKWHF